MRWLAEKAGLLFFFAEFTLLLMEVIALEEDYKAKYEKLVAQIKGVEASARAQLHDFPEPDWPDTINDRKEVMWFRNDVFDHAYAVGMLGGCRQILHAVEEF